LVPFGFRPGHLQSEWSNLTIQPVELVEVFERILRDAESRVQYHFVVVDYLCRILSGELRPGTDVTEIRWARLEELPMLGITPETRNVIQKALNIARTVQVKNC